MKPLILCLILLIYLTSLSALEITQEHFGYHSGSVRKLKQGSWNQASTDLSEGSGKTWSFAMPSMGFVNNGYSQINGATGFPSANIACHYTQSINGIDDSGTLYYQNNGTDILSLGYTAATDLVWNPPIPTGLPHTPGKTWQGNHTYTYGSYTVTGKVISEGTISTPLGSYQALCVHYHYNTTNFNYDIYQWETEVYGIIAYALSLNGGMLYVLEEATPNVTALEDACLVPIPRLKVYPNPVQDFLKVITPQSLSSQWDISLYDLRGRKVKDFGNHLVPPSESEIRLEINPGELPYGIYILRAANPQQRFHTRIVISD
ncbi:MAG TPA: T9SS type A sorting domain-containing protein [Candidatus Cloacimonadota bacterium]|nr:T9SS type A sorting domain-containing protein [Candidatus Cloacimonadota bacterium]